MFSCPHCGKPGIRSWDKYWASPADPAVCQQCNKTCGISALVESASAALYFIAGFCALGFFGMQAMSRRSDSPIGGPTPLALLISWIAFYVAGEAAKLYWAPLRAFSATEVARKRSAANRYAATAVIIVIASTMLYRCGY